MPKVLDIVSFAIPDPPDYGGVIDVYYRVRALVRAYPHVRLHCFSYGDRTTSSQLERLCEVCYYPRSRSWLLHLDPKPFIVASRQSKSLLTRLAGVEGPILFEGLHTCAHIADAALIHRLRAVRMHNVEHDYYRHLARETAGYRALHFWLESRKLRRFQPQVLRAADLVLPISDAETAYFSARHDQVQILPPFHPFEKVSIQPGVGEYVLVQGDMRLPHNRHIVAKVAPVCADLGIRCVVAGRAADQHTGHFLREFKNIEIHSNVSQEMMRELMANAQVHVIDARTTAGFKLKLLAALFTARQVLAHADLLDETLSMIAHSFRSEGELRSQLERLVGLSVDPAETERRKAVLLPRFSNEVNARNLLHQLGLTA